MLSSGENDVLYEVCTCQKKVHIMSLTDGQSTREWQEIIQEASVEHDPAKLKRLRDELEIVLEERAKRMREQSTPQAQEKSAQSQPAAAAATPGLH